MKKNIIYVLFLGLLLSSCVRESPLSDIELEDPALIAPSIILERDMDGEVLSTKMEVWLFDRNVNSFKLKNGVIKMNGTAMELQSQESLVENNGVPYYTCKALGDVKLNTNYKLEVQLGNGETYSSAIKTPAKDLKLILPASVDPAKGFEISWDNSQAYEGMSVYMWRNYQNGKSQQLSSMIIPSNDVQAGRFFVSSEKILKNDLSKEENLGELESLVITLEANTSKGATIDERFHTNSKAEITYKTKKKVSVK
jgi:hypothetical protein